MFSAIVRPYYPYETTSLNKPNTIIWVWVIDMRCWQIVLHYDDRVAYFGRWYASVTEYLYVCWVTFRSINWKFIKIDETVVGRADSTIPHMTTLPGSLLGCVNDYLQGKTFQCMYSCATLNRVPVTMKLHDLLPSTRRPMIIYMLFLTG